MKSPVLYLGIIVILFFGFSFGFSEEMPVAPDVVALVRIDISPTDPGLAWLYNHWATGPRRSAIRDLVVNHTPSSAIAALYPESKESSIPYTVILTYPQVVNASLGFTNTIEKILKPEDKNAGYFIKNISS
ncbi:MAG: hypothetical protein ACE14V_15240, partial [bacterium]